MSVFIDFCCCKGKKEFLVPHTDESVKPLLGFFGLVFFFFFEGGGEFNVVGFFFYFLMKAVL